MTALRRVLLFLVAVIHFNASGAIAQFDVSHLAGGPGGSGYIDGIGLNARFSEPTGIWGSGDSLYIADSDERSVRRVVRANGQVTTIAKLDQLACTSTSSRTMDRRLTLWTDGVNAYIGDACLHVVYKIDLTSGQVAVLAGQLQKFGSVNGPGPQALFDFPNILWGDASFLYLANTVGLRKVDKATGEVTADFTNISGIVGLDDTFIFRIVQSNQNVTLQSIRIATGDVKDLVGLSSSLFIQSTPSRRTEGSEDYLYIAFSDNTIKRIRTSTGEMTTFAGGIGTPQGNIGGWKDGPGATAEFFGIGPMWADGEYLYAVERFNNTVRKIRFSSAEVATLAGMPAIRATVDGPGGVARFQTPQFVWGDGNYLYVTGLLGSIRRVRISDGQTSTIAGKDSLPIYQDPSSDGVGVTARFQLPSGIWGDGASLYVVDRGGYTIRKIDLATAEVTTIAGLTGSSGSVDGIGSQARFRAPRSIWGDGTHLYITDEATVRMMNVATREVRTLAGTAGAFGTNDGFGTAARFDQAGGIWGDQSSLYVTDSATIRKIALATTQVTTLAGKARERDTVDGVGTAALFNSPLGIWGDTTFLYVTENTGYTVRRVRKSNGETVTIAGMPGKDGSDDTRDLAARFSIPYGIWGDGNDLFVVDSGNSAIRRLSPLKTGAEPHVISVSPSRIMPGMTDTFTIDGTNFDSSASAILANGLGVRLIANEVRSATTLVLTVQADSNAPAGSRVLRIVQNNSSSNPIAFDVGPPVDRFIKTVTVNGRGSFSTITVQQPGAASVGYARITAQAGEQAPAGFAIFGYRTAGVLVSETSVPAADLIQAGRISFDSTGPANTGIAVVNPNTTPVRLSYTMTRPDGSQLREGAIDLATGEQLSRFLNEFPYPGAPFQTSGTFSFAATSPVSVIALRGFVNERGDFLMSTLPVVDLAAPANRPVVIPHIADGGGWTSRIELVNPTDQPLTGRLEFVSAAGGALQIALGSQTGSAFDYAIPSKGSVTFTTSGAAPDTRTGWIRVIPSAGTYPSGDVIFSFRQNGVVVTEAAAPATRFASVFRQYVGSVRTGFAIANPASSAIQLSFDLTDLNGNTVGSTVTRTIGANMQMSLFIDELSGFQNLPAGFTGVMRVSTTAASGFCMIGLRGQYNTRGDFLISTAQSIDETPNPAPPSERLFPHFVQSGGYTTEFVLFPTNGSPASVRLRFYSQSGQSFDLPLVEPR